MAIFLGVSFYYVTKLTHLPKVTKNQGMVILSITTKDGIFAILKCFNGN